MTCHRIDRVSILMGILMGTAQLISGAPMIDQSFTVTPPSLETTLSIGGGSALGQSFTVGIAGLLTGADLLVFDGSAGFGLNHPSASDVGVQIRTVVAGLPTDTVLASGVIPAAMLAPNPFTARTQFSHVNFAAGIAVIPGEVLALTITGSADGWYGQIGSQATYPGGQGFSRASSGSPWVPFSSVDTFGRPSDFLFRTFVDPTAVPEYPLLGCC
jgi:hypothetical protein